MASTTNEYTIISYLCFIVFIILAFAAVVTEPKKHSAGWYALIIFMSILLLAGVVTMHLSTSKAIKKNLQITIDKTKQDPNAMAKQNPPSYNTNTSKQ